MTKAMFPFYSSKEPSLSTTFKKPKTNVNLIFLLLTNTISHKPLTIMG